MKWLFSTDKKMQLLSLNEQRKPTGNALRANKINKYEKSLPGQFCRFVFDENDGRTAVFFLLNTHIPAAPLFPSPSYS